MSLNLIQKVQEKLGYPPLKKIDANTGHVTINNKTPNEERFSQAVIPTVLSALYRFTRTDEGADIVLHNSLQGNWSDIIFDDKKQEVLDKVSAYSYYNISDIEPEINEVAQCSVNIAREQLPQNAKLVDIKNIFADSLNNTLLYLPTDMHIGKSLHDNTMDDNIHKMEGPISSVVNALGSLFSNSESDEKDIVAGNKTEA